MQAFYVKKEKKLLNVNVKDNEIKYFLTKVLNLFFQGIPDETVKNNQSKACPLSG